MFKRDDAGNQVDNTIPTGVGIESSASYDPSSLESTPGRLPDVYAEAPQPKRRFKLLRYNKPAAIATAIAAVVIIGAVLTTLAVSGFRANDKSVDQKASDKYSAKDLSVANLSDDDVKQINQADKLSINGQLTVDNTLVIAPTSAPSKPTTGQLYLDSATKSLKYFNGTTFVSLDQKAAVTSLNGASGSLATSSDFVVTANQLLLSNDVKQAISGPRVSSLQGQSGDVQLASGQGIAINGTTITNTGILSVDGVNGVQVTTANGAVTVALPQQLSTTSSPTFAGLQLGSALGVAYGGTGLNTGNLVGNSVLITNQAGTGYQMATPTAADQCLVTDSTASHQVKFAQCPGAQNSGVTSVRDANGNATSGNVVLSVGTNSPLSVSASTLTNTIALNLAINATNLKTNGGVLDTVQDISTTSSPTFSSIALTNALSLTNGGTGSTSAAGARNNLGAAASGVNTDITSLTGLTTALSTSQGGTGATTAAGARANLNAASAGANADITALTGLTTALSVSQGGTGFTTVSANQILIGGTSNSITQLANGGAGQCLVSNGTSAAPTFQTCTGAGGVSSLNGQNGSVTLANATAAAGTITIDNAKADGLTKGIAAFTSANFTASNGVIDTIQGIATTSTPTFASLTLTSALSLSNGGTGSTTANGARTNIGAAASGANTDITSLSGLTTALSLSQGGTGATSANGARTNIGAAASGANGDITSITGLTTALSVAQGGTGFTTVNANQLLVGGTSANSITQLASGTIGQCLLSNGTSAAPTFQTCTGAGGVSSVNGLSGALTLANASAAGATITINDAKADGTTKGIAAFVSTNFSASSGVINTIQDIATTSTPTFNGLNLSAALTTSNGGTGSTTAAGARTNLGAAASGANSDITSLSGLTTALSLGQGGTGSTTANGARTNIGAAASGANSDITSLSGLTTALSVSQGGTGLTTISANQILLGGASNTITQLANGGVGQCLISNGTSAAPTFQTCTGAGGVSSVNGQNGAITISNATGAAGTVTIDNAKADGTSKGIAAFTSGNFTASNGVIDTIQGIATTSTPTFASLTLTSALSIANGGTGSTTANGARSNIGAAASGANSDITSLSGLTTALSITQGGTGATTAAGARTAIGAAASGANSDITSITGLTTALSVAQGGTGLTTINANQLLIGGASNSVSQLTNGTSGQCLVSNGTGASPTFQTCTGAGGVSSLNGLSGALTLANATASGATVTINDAKADGTTKGIAGFVSNNFAASSGIISIKTGGITTTEIADGTITNLDIATDTITTTNIKDGTITSTDIADGTITGSKIADGTVANNNVVDSTITGTKIANNTVANSNLVNSSLSVTAGTGLSGGGSISLGGSTSLSVAYGSTTGTAVQGNTTLTCPVGAGNLTGGGNAITLGTGGTCGAIDITSSPVFAGTLAVQGSGGITVGTNSVAGAIKLSDGAATAHTATINTSGVLASNQTYALPTTGGTICVLEAGNCTGSNGGAITSSGTPTQNYLTKFTNPSGSTIGNSSIYNDATGVSIGGASPAALFNVGATNQFQVSTTGAVTAVGVNSGSGLIQGTGGLTIGGTTKFSSLTSTGGQCLTTDATGVLTLISCLTGSGGGSGGVASLNGLSGALNLSNASGTGTTVTIDNAKADGVTKGIAAFNAINFTAASGVINTVQDITTTSTPTFGGLILSTALSLGNGGTGATTASTARTNLGAAASGANSDITSISGLTTALSVSQGGTGLASVSAGQILLGGAGNTITQLSNGGTGQCLVSNGAGVAPSFQTCTGAGGVASINSQTGAVTIANSTAATGTITIDNAKADGTTKGIAAFDGTNFSASLGVINTIQGISTGSAPNFAGLTLTGGASVTSVSASGTITTVSGLIAGSPSTGSSVAGSLKLYGGTDTSSITLQGTAQGAGVNTVISFPAGLTSTDTICLQTRANCSGAGASTVGTIDGGTYSANGASITSNTLYLQTATATHVGLVNTSAQTFGGDKTFANNLIVGSNQSLILTGGTTANRPASPTEGTIYYDTTTKKLLVYSNGKWQADRSTATRIVGTAVSGGPSGAVASIDPDGADYVNTTSGQVAINAAISSLPSTGGTVYLMEGTYIITDAINVPNNVTLIGAGPATILKLSNGTYVDSMLRSTDTNTGTGISISNLTLDGNKSSGAGGRGMFILAGGINRKGATIENITVHDFSEGGIFVDGYSTVRNNTIYSDGSFGVRNNTSGDHNMIESNIIYDNVNGIQLSTGQGTVISGNTIRGNSNAGILLNGTGGSQISQNYLQDNATYGIYSTYSGDDIFSNTISSSGGSTANNAIYLDHTNGAIINSNFIGDGVPSGPNYAINISDSTSNDTHIANNSLGYMATINDQGTHTVYAGQVNASSNYMLQPAGTIELMKSTNVTGSLTANGAISAQGAGGLSAGTPSTGTGVTGQLKLYGGSDTSSITIQATAQGAGVNTVIGFPTGLGATDTICLQTKANCSGSGASTIGTLDGGTANANGATISSNVLYLQSASATVPGVVNTLAQTFAGDKTFNGTTSLTGSLIVDSTSVTANSSITVAAGKSITVVGGNTASRPSSPTEGMVYFDTTTKKLLTYSNGKWQADGKDSLIVAASNSSQADKDAADYITDGDTAAANDGDQVQINQALTDGAGKKIVLLAGTYVIDNTVYVPSQTTFTGVGASTVIERTVAANTSTPAVRADAGSNNSVVIQNMKLDGRNDINTGGSDGLQLIGSGSLASNRAGATVNNIIITRFPNSGLFSQSGSQGNTITNNTIYNNGGAGIYFYGGNYNTFSNNSISSNAQGMLIENSATRNTITNNRVYNNSNYGIRFNSSTYNTVSNNYFVDNGGSTANLSIIISTSNNNIVTGNVFSDSSATTTNYSVQITTSSSSSTYIAGNDLGGSTIQDNGTGTIYGGQVDASNNYLLQPAGTIQLQKSTTVTGNFTVTGNTDLQGTTKVALSGTTGTTQVCQNTGGQLSACDSSVLTPSAANFIQNQNSTVQTGTFNINGTGAAVNGFLSSYFDTGSAASLSIGTTNATNIQIGQTSSGYTKINNIGYVGSYFVTGNGRFNITPGSAGTPGQVIRGLSGQTSDLIQFQDSTGAILTSVGAAGSLNVSTTSGVAATIKGVGGSDLLDFKNSGGGTVAKVDEYGNITGVKGVFRNDQPTSASTVDITFNNTATSGTTFTKAQQISLLGSATSGSNYEYGIDFLAVTPATNNVFTGLNFGSGYDSALTVNGFSIINGAGKLQNAGFDSSINYNNLQKVTALTATGNVDFQGNTKVALSGTTGTTQVCQNAAGQLSTCDSTVLAPTASNFIQNAPATAQTGSLNLAAAAGKISTIQGAAGQDIIQFKQSSGTLQAYIDQFGNYHGPAAIYSGTYSANASNVATNTTNSSTAAGTTTVNAFNVGLFGTNNYSGTNVLNGLNLANVNAAVGNVFNGLYYGTGYNSLLNYNGTSIINGTGQLQNAGFDSTANYSNLQKVTNLTASGNLEVQGTTKVALPTSTSVTLVCSNGGILSTCDASAGSGGGAGNYIRNQTATLDTGSFRIDGSGTAASFIATTGFVGTSFDRSNAGAINIGNTNATTINIATNNGPDHTVNIASSAGNNFVTLGSSTSSSSLTLQAGSNGITINTSGANVNLGSTGVFNFKDSSTNTLFAVDANHHQNISSFGSELSVQGTATFNYGMTINGANNVLNYVTPLGANLATNINITNYAVNAFGTIFASGLPSTADVSARGILIADARTGVKSNHQPTIGVLSPGENNIFGFSYEGQDTTGYIKALSGNIAIRSNTTDIAQFNPTGVFLNQATQITAASGAVAATVQGASGQNIAEFKSNGGTTVASISASTLTTNYNFTGSGTSIKQNVTNGSASGNITVSAQEIALAGTTTSGTNTINGVQFDAVTPITNNTFNGLYFGIGYNSLLNYNGTSLISGLGKLQNTALDSAVNYSNLQNVTNLTASGTLAAAGNITSGTSSVAGSLILTNGNGTTSTINRSSTTNATFTLPTTGGTLCTTTTCAAAGGSYISNSGVSNTQQTGANINITANTGVVAATFQGAAGVDIAQFITSGGNTPLKISQYGQIVATNGISSSFTSNNSNFATNELAANLTATSGNYSGQAATISLSSVDTTGINLLTGINLQSVTPKANTGFTGITIGTGYNAILNYGSTQLISGLGKFQDAGFDSGVTYTNIQKLNNVTVTGSLQSSNLDAGTGNALAIGTANATAISIGKAGITTTIQGTTSVATLTASNNVAITSTTAGSAFSVSSSVNATTGNALIFVNNTNASATGSLITAQNNGSNVFTVDVGGNVVVKNTLTVTGNTTANRPGSPTEGMLYYDTTLHQLLTWNGSKWQADRSSGATKTVGTSASGGTSSAVASINSDGADYVNTSTTSAQTMINNALTAVSSTGGTVFLMEGTYVIDGSISIPNNVTLIGSGTGTVIKLKNGTNANLNAIVNSDTSTGTNVNIGSLKLDGNKANNTSGNQIGIYLNAMGASTTRVGAKLTGLTVANFRNEGVSLLSSASNNITGNAFASNGANGLTLNASVNNTVTSNTSQSNSSDGIALYGGSVNNTISTNVLQANGSNGLTVLSSNNNNFSGNTASSNSQNGIYLSTANNNTVSANTANSNTNGFRDDGGANNTFTGNTALNESSTGFYSHGTNSDVFSGNSASAVTYAMLIDNVSFYTSVSGNSFTGSGYGIYANGSDSSTFTANNLSSNYTGVQLVNTTGSTIGGNSIKNSGGPGIYLTGSTKNTISNNAIAESGGSTTNNGIFLDNSSNNSMLGNNITDTTATSYNNAILISNAATSTANYLSDNSFNGAATIADNGVGTLYGGQNDGTSYKIAPNQAVNITSNAASSFATTAGTLSLQGAGGVNISTTNIGVSSAISLTSGNSSAGIAGTVSIDNGTSSAGNSVLNIGANNAKLINFGNTATTTTVSGAFKIQNSAVDIFSVKANGDIVIGTAANNTTFAASSNYEPTLNGSAQHTKNIRLTAEYNGAAFDAAGDSACTGTNSGSMTAGFDATSIKNFYDWKDTTGTTTTQCYDVVVQVPVPSDWAGWTGTPSLEYYGSSTTNTSGAVDVIGGDLSSDGTYTTNGITVSTANSWQTKNLQALTNSKYTAGSTNVTLRIRMNAKSGADFKIGNINIPYKSKY